MLPFSFPAVLIQWLQVWRRQRNLLGKVLRLIQVFLTPPSLEKIALTCQANSPQARIADSSSRKALNFSSARTMKRFPSPRCASAIQTVRP
jgi:hypothetical protein